MIRIGPVIIATADALFQTAKVSVLQSLKSTTNEKTTEDIKAVMSNPAKMSNFSISII